MQLAGEADATTVHDLREAAAGWQVTRGIVQWSGEISRSAVVNQVDLRLVDQVPQVVSASADGCPWIGVYGD